MGRKSTGAYPDNWTEIAIAVKDAAGWQCVRCGHPHDIASGHMLTVHHLDLNPANCAWWNTPALCQRCHLRIQAKVNMDRVWVMAYHSEWFEPYVAGFYAWKYLGEQLTRDEVMARIDELLNVERIAVLGGA
jgi:hypothetical protein